MSQNVLNMTKIHADANEQTISTRQNCHRFVLASAITHISENVHCIRFKTYGISLISHLCKYYIRLIEFASHLIEMTV
jgi:hypothetical protein